MPALQALGCFFYEYNENEYRYHRALMPKGGVVVKTIKLSELEVKGYCRVDRVIGRRSIKKRLLEMGFVKGAEIYVEKVAPLGDPMELVLKGYHLCLRRDEAKDVHIEKLERSH